MTFLLRPSGSKADLLKQAVDDAPDERSRLSALLALARHYAQVSDGVNGLHAARAARSLALALDDWGAVAHALNSASVSQYHRNDGPGALATAIDAWDSARRSGSAIDAAESLYTIGLAMNAIGEVEDAMRVADKGLAITATDPAMRDTHIRLVGLKGLLCLRQGRTAEMERHCAKAVELAKEAGAHLLELGHGNWGYALLRTAEQRIARGESAGDLLARARTQFDQALELATAEGDVTRVADRLSALGQVAWVEGRERDAERMLADAMQRASDLDYARVVVMSARYLGTLYLARGDCERAIEVLRVADEKARRGVPVDNRPAVKLLLATALERCGNELEADRMREAAALLGESEQAHAAHASAQARKLAARVLAESAPG